MIGQILQQDLRFPFHYFIFIYFRCLIAKLYLTSLYIESNQGALVSIFFLFVFARTTSQAKSHFNKKQLRG